MNSISAYDVANAFVKLSDPDSGDVLTNLKLQKLVYYVQGFHVALKGVGIFEQPIIAWEHGPVVEELYHQLKKFGSSQVLIGTPLSTSFNGEQLELIGDINNVYGQYSAWKLRDMTHHESPWASTERNGVISTEKLQKYFKTQLQ